MEYSSRYLVLSIVEFFSPGGVILVTHPLTILGDPPFAEPHNPNRTREIYHRTRSSGVFIDEPSPSPLRTRPLCLNRSRLRTYPRHGGSCPSGRTEHGVLTSFESKERTCSREHARANRDPTLDPGKKKALTSGRNCPQMQLVFHPTRVASRCPPLATTSARASVHRSLSV